MFEYIQYGDKQKLLNPFYGDSSIIQQFNIGNYVFLQSLSLFIHFNNCNHNYAIQMVIVDQQQNLYFNKQLNLVDVKNNDDFFEIPINIKLVKNNRYFLCLDSYGNGNINNNISFYVGYRKKMMNFFINNKFSLGQLYCKFKVNNGE